MLSRLVLDRNTDVPLFRQLRAAIEMRIIDGTLTDGAHLPSIRCLASELGVANVTVIQAYNDLQARGYIRSVPKRGFFVTSGISATPAPVSTERLAEAIDKMFEVAREDGIGELDAIQFATQQLRERLQRSVSIAIVGYLNASLEERVAYTQASLADTGVVVSGVSFESLERLDSVERDNYLQPFDVFLVSVGETDHASSLLQSHVSRILPMTRTLRGDVIDAIADQPISTRFGIIAYTTEYSDRMIAELRRVRPNSVVSAVALVTDAEAVHFTLENSDVILIGSVAGPLLDADIPTGVDLVKFHFVPDNQTLQRLRDVLDTYRLSR